MSGKTKTVMAALFFFGSASADLADTDNRTDHHESAARRAVSVTMSNRRVAVASHAVKPSIPENKVGLAPPQLVFAQRTPLCRRGIAGSTMVWIKLTEPGGKLVHINVEQVTSVRSDTQILGARAQIDLASGKFQGVQENVDQVMQLIMAAAGARANDECA